jgi:PIN domain nuclease of toxin-antitoxin system
MNDAIIMDACALIAVLANEDGADSHNNGAHG